MKNRIENRMVKKDGTMNSRYDWVVASILNRIASGEKVARFYGKRWTGSPRHRQLEDNQYKYEDVLEALGIAYKVGNDAPRGGIEGDYVEARFDGRNRAVAEIRKVNPVKIDDCVDLFNNIIKGGDR